MTEEIILQQAIANLKQTLIKWAVVCGFLTVLTAIFSANTLLSNNDTSNAEALETAPINSLTQQDKIATYMPAQKPLAPIVAISTPPGSSAESEGNAYAAGNCTWYAKHKRPDLPNNLHNANTWVSLAKAQGIPTGPAPRVGAVGQQGMHVVYVEKVNGDGTVFISEMNYKGLGIVSSRTALASSFTYIY